MIERFLEIEPAIMQLEFQSFEWILSAEDVALLRTVAEVIKDVVAALALMEGEKYPTLPVAIPFIITHE